MTKFIKHLISILILVVALLYISDIFYTQIYLKTNPRNKLQYILNTKNKNFDIVFLGSSRVANHIDAKLFDSLSNMKTINLGVEGAGLNDNLLQLKLLLSNNNTISNLFIQIDNNFESESPSTIAISEAMPFLKNKIIKKHIRKYFKNFDELEYIPFYRYALNDPKIGFRELFFSLINKKPRINQSIGFTPKFGNRLPLIGGSLPKSISKSNIVLNEIIDICKINKIKLILFISPYCKKTKNIEYLEKLKIKVPNIIDLSKGYNENLFYNCGHLNNQGAKIFTNKLYNATKDKIKNEARKHNNS